MDTGAHRGYSHELAMASTMAQPQEALQITRSGRTYYI
jgi:hypothetical protein